MLTRECRPQVFEDVAGQELTKRVLTAVIAKPEEAPKSIILQGPFGCGKCVKGTTRIATPFGYIPIKEFCESLVEGELKEGFTDIDFSKKSKAVVLGEQWVRSIQRVFVSHHSYVKTVVLESGEEINGTPEHRIRVYDKNDGYVWRPIGEIHPGDYVLRNNRPLLYGNYTSTSDFEQMIKLLRRGYDCECDCNAKERFEKILRAHPDNRFVFYKLLFRFFDFKETTVHASRWGIDWLVALAQSLGVVPKVSYGDGVIRLPRIKEIKYNMSFDEKPGCHCYGESYMTKLARDVYVASRDFERAWANGYSTWNEARSEFAIDVPGVFHDFTPVKVIQEYSDYDTVYDVSMDIYHDFYAQGVINHNTTQARILAKGLNCLGSGAKPCGKCANCLKDLDTSGFYDEYDSAVIGQVEKIRELRDSFYVNNAGYKVVVLDESHLCSKQAQSAFLKVLEEAPKSVFFVFCTTEVDKILPTIRSRSLELELSLVPETQILESLHKICKKYDLHFSDEALNLVVVGSHGHMRNAHMLLDKLSMVGEEDFRKSLRSSSDAIYRWFEAVVQKNNTACFSAVEEILSFPVSEVGVTFTNEVRMLSRAMVGQENRYSPLVKVLGTDCLKLVKLCVSDWVVSSLGSDPTIEATLLCIFSLMLGSKTQAASAPAQVNRFSRR